jgi:hypothetical protein
VRPPRWAFHPHRTTAGPCGRRARPLSAACR